MNESVKQPLSNAKEKVRYVMKQRLLKDSVAAFSGEGWESVSEYMLNHLKSLGIQPKFIQESNPEFEKMRNKLNTEAGIIICNHPGGAETPAILSLIKRNDFKIMVSKNIYENFPPEIAAKYFFPAEYKDHSKTNAIFNEIEEHIKKGGVLLIYPSGGREEKLGFHFESGFRVILRMLKPDQMVYCFNVNPSDAASLASHKTTIGIGSELFFHPSLNINRVGNPTVVRMDEAYTQALEWQSEIDVVPKNESNQVLASKYENMFSSNMSTKS